MSRYGLTLQIGKSLYSTAVLIDTSAFVALTNPSDTHHHIATHCSHEIARHHLPLYVSFPTICETHRRILFDLGSIKAQRFIQDIYDGTIHIIRTTEDDESNAIQLMGQYEGLQLTLVDAINMAVMSRLGIGKAFSFDRHYLQAGFIRIPPLYP